MQRDVYRSRTRDIRYTGENKFARKMRAHVNLFIAVACVFFGIRGMHDRESNFVRLHLPRLNVSDYACTDRDPSLQLSTSMDIALIIPNVS